MGNWRQLAASSELTSSAAAIIAAVRPSCVRLRGPRLENRQPTCEKDLLRHVPHQAKAWRRTSSTSGHGTTERRDCRGGRKAVRDRAERARGEEKARGAARRKGEVDGGGDRAARAELTKKEAAAPSPVKQPLSSADAEAVGKIEQQAAKEDEEAYCTFEVLASTNSWIYPRAPAAQVSGH